MALMALAAGGEGATCCSCSRLKKYQPSVVQHMADGLCLGSSPSVSAVANLGHVLHAEELAVYAALCRLTRQLLRNALGLIWGEEVGCMASGLCFWGVILGRFASRTATEKTFQEYKAK